MPDLEYLTVLEVAEELAVSGTIVTALVRSGTLLAQHLPNGKLRFERAMFERWIREQDTDTRRWVLEHQSRGTHGPWQADWRE